MALLNYYKFYEPKAQSSTISRTMKMGPGGCVNRVWVRIQVSTLVSWVRQIAFHLTGVKMVPRMRMISNLGAILAAGAAYSQGVEMNSGMLKTQ